ncbi:MAG: anthranilate phosphoribosyltransferase [Kofleriaceae bacterium]|jgi:anthranilate phosphoribosyltransferase|nr:anthranilate phosphoribosyltransferase [Kofleriaceae bacterium]MBP9207836.1 anthranilate phosphoribosyltransferase [Kofleriaceae bacterium]
MSTPAGPLTRSALARVIAGEQLAADVMAEVFAEIMDGGASPAQIGGLLVALRMRGETASELAGAARAMRARAEPLPCPDPARAVDTCGTGGDGTGSINVSTLAAIVAAGAGAVVAKHGNRALTSRAGSADVLEALGVRIDLAPAAVARCLTRAGIGFAFAPRFHAATRHAAGPRRELGVRTLFNLLGPMTNPAQVAHQVIGVFDARWCEPVAAALGQLGARRVFVVHGAGGIDEVAVAGPTEVAQWHAGRVERSVLTPASFGLEEVDPAGLAGSDAAGNAHVLRQVLAGDGIGPGQPRRAAANAAVMEAALALVACGLAEEPRAGAAQAAAALADGRAAAVLTRWVNASHVEAEPA